MGRMRNFNYYQNSFLAYTRNSDAYRRLTAAKYKLNHDEIRNSNLQLYKVRRDSICQVEKKLMDYFFEKFPAIDIVCRELIENEKKMNITLI